MPTGRDPYSEASKAVGRGPQQSPVSIVAQAGAILREEIQMLAAGGAKRPAPAPRVEAITQAPAEALLEPARSLIDTVVNSLKLRPDLIAQLLKISADGGTRDSANQEAVLVLRAPGPVAAGDVAHISLSLENDGEADHCTLYATDLIGIAGHRIPASSVRVQPNPTNIPAAGSTPVQIDIRVPGETCAGRYTGLLQTDDGESLRALIQIAVG